MKTQWQSYQGKRMQVFVNPHVCPHHKVELITLMDDPGRDLCPICDRGVIEAAITEKGQDDPGMEHFPQAAEHTVVPPQTGTSKTEIGADKPKKEKTEDKEEKKLDFSPLKKEDK